MIIPYAMAHGLLFSVLIVILLISPYQISFLMFLLSHFPRFKCLFLLAKSSAHYLWWTTHFEATEMHSFLIVNQGCWQSKYRLKKTRQKRHHVHLFQLVCVIDLYIDIFVSTDLLSVFIRCCKVKQSELSLFRRRGDNRQFDDKFNQFISLTNGQ